MGLPPPPYSLLGSFSHPAYPLPSAKCQGNTMILTWLKQTSASFITQTSKNYIISLPEQWACFLELTKAKEEIYTINRILIASHSVCHTWCHEYRRGWIINECVKMAALCVYVLILSYHLNTKYKYSSTKYRLHHIIVLWLYLAKFTQKLILFWL